MSARSRSSIDIYHVFARGAGRQIIFEDNDDRKIFLGLLEKTARQHAVEIHAWCLMDNHYHLLLHAPITHISKLVQKTNAGYASHFNSKHDRVGHLFQDRFKSEPINDENHFLAAMRYIHENPVKAGICPAQDYRWSSYSEYAGLSPAPGLCQTDLALNMIGGIDAFEAFHREELDRRENFLDVDSPNTRQRRSPEALVRHANSVIPEVRVGDVGSLPKKSRNEILRRLKTAGLSVREIERLTGVGRGIIQRI